MIYLCFMLAVWFGWVLRGQKVREEMTISIHDQMIQDAFNSYLEITGEHHPQDPRNVRLKVVQRTAPGGD